MKNRDFFDLILSYLKDRKEVKYYIDGRKLKLEYKNKRYFISSLSNKKTFSIEKVYRDSLVATLVCLEIPTLNPAAVVINFILNIETKAIQITGITSKNKVLKTDKILKEYLKNFPIIKYGDVTIFSELANFNYEYFNSVIFNEFCDDDTISNALHDVIFDKCNYFLDRKIFKAKIAEIEKKYKIGNYDGRVQRIY